MTTIESLYSIFLKSSGVSIDTRTLKRGNIFFALSGDKNNGNEYIDEAFDKGAIAAVANDTYIGSDTKCIIVSDVLKCLQNLATHHRKIWGKTVFAITGSNGKTTSKELCASVLQESFRIALTAGNFNNHIGVPLTLLSIQREDDMAIIEMGANHPGEIARLCEIAQPTLGVITNIGQAHLEGFGSLEGVLKAKTELFRYLSRNKGLVFVHSRYDCLLHAAGKDLPVIKYGEQDGDFLKASLKSVFPSLCIKILNPAPNYEVMMNLYGGYNFENAILAACVGHYFGVNSTWIKKRLEAYVPDNNRSQLIEQNDQQIILDAYNANPASMRSAIQQFSDYPAKRKVAILGDMFELGELEQAAHQEIAALAESKAFDLLILVGKVFRTVEIRSETKVFSKTATCSLWLSNHPFTDQNAILIKGSRGMKLESIVPEISLVSQ